MVVAAQLLQIQMLPVFLKLLILETFLSLTPSFLNKMKNA